MQALTAALTRQIPVKKIQTGHQVVSLCRAGEETEVVTQSQTGIRTAFSCTHVFLALPPALAANIAFTPPLPERLVSNWRNIPTWMAPHAKYVALYKTDFLSLQHLSGEAGSRVGPMAEIHDVSEPDSGRTAIFGFIGVPAKARWAVSEAQLKALCQEQLVRLFGQDAAEPDADFIKDWAADPFTATESDLSQAVGDRLPQQVNAQGAWAGQITGIASEWSRQFPGYLAGAIDAASEGVHPWLQQR